jgi:hypothetical protein
MLASFTQTYGDKRKKLHEIYSRDNQMIEFKSHFDINYHSFHNCNQETIDYYKSINKVNNVEYLIFNDIGYGECIKKLKVKLKEEGCTHFFFSQDDTFGADNEKVDYNDLLNKVTKYDKNFQLVFKHFPEIKRYKIDEDGFLFTSTREYWRFGPWAMDDSPYIATLDKVNEIYDDHYVTIPDVWNCERYINEKYGKEKLNTIKHFMAKTLFYNHNIIGRYLGSGKDYQGNLERRGMW